MPNVQFVLTVTESFKDGGPSTSFGAATIRKDVKHAKLLRLENCRITLKELTQELDTPWAAILKVKWLRVI